MERVGFKDFVATVSEDGDIFRPDGRKYPKRVDKYGYYRVSLYYPPTQRTHTFLVHRLVAEEYIPNPDNKKVVNHKDGNKQNNTVANLEWVDATDNARHAYEFGLRKFTPRKGGKRDYYGRFTKE